MGRGGEILYAHIGRREQRRRGQKEGRGDSRAMRLQSRLKVRFCSLGKSLQAMMCTCMHKHTHCVCPATQVCLSC